MELKPSSNCVKRLLSRAGVHVLCVLTVFVPVMLFLSPIIALLLNPFGSEHDQPILIEPRNAFLHLTGWSLPPGSSIQKNVNTHSGFKNDGDYVLIAHLPPDELNAKLRNDSREWRSCPVDSSIMHHAHSMPAHTGTKYFAQKTSSSDRDWHRGHLVTVDSRIGMVWIYEWKR